MRQEKLRWKRWLAPVGLVLACLLIAVGALTGRVAARQSAPPLGPPGEQIEPPSAQEEALWAAVGLNDAWYIANGYTENPPPSAPSPFWPATKESTDQPEVLTPSIIEEPRAFIDPPNVAGQALADHGTMPLVAALCGSENNYCEDNDTAGTAYGSLGLGITYQAYPDDIDDYYYFELSAARTVVIDVMDFAPTSSNGTVVLYPAVGEDKGDPIEHYGPPGHSSMLLGPHWLGQGKYFVRVYTASSYTTTQLYDLTVTAQSERSYLPLALRHFRLNHPPFVPSSPQPPGGATDQGVNVSLRWTGADPDGDSLTYDVFLAANDNTPDVLVCDDATSASCNPGTLSYETTYFWQVIARDPDGVTTSGPVWSFSTQKPMTEVRAIWLTRYDWTAYSGGDEGRAKFDEIVANVAGAGFNTIFFQVRGNGDAYYEPGLEPWSARLNNGGVLGQRPYPYWDPLGYMIEKAHARGIQVHAYVNMYPTWVGTEAPPQGTEPEHPYWTWSSVHGQLDWRQRNSTGQISPAPENKYLWASPGVDEVRDHIVAVVSDIVSRYNVDGVHLDLVRYINRDYSYDPISNAAIAASGKDRGEWQRERVTDLVRRIYEAIGQPESGIHLSAAVWFCYDDCGFGLSSGFAGRYQDSIGWLRDGIIDAIAPMLYAADAFQSNSTWQTVMLQFQDREEIAGRPVYPGIHGTLSFSDIATRIQYARDAGAVGHAIFSYGHVNQNGYWDDFANGPYAQPATHAPLP